MSEIDWSKAPLGAMRFKNTNNDCIWLKKVSELVFFCEYSEWYPYGNQTIGLNHWNNATPRPDTTTPRTAESSAIKTRKCHDLMCENMVEGNVGTYCGCNRAVVDEIDDTVTQRGERYGLFADGAVIMQDLKAVMRATPGWERLTPSQREALEMIQHKIGRVLNGDPMYDDSWRDISGYSTLILNELNGVK